MKKENGITLVALVISIIVLLILAGVTIATLTGDNGLLTKAGEAKNASTETSTLEKIQVEVAASYGFDGAIDLNLLNNNLKNIKGLIYNEDVLSNTNMINQLPSVVKLDEYSYVIKKNGSVEQVVWVQDKTKITNIKTGQILEVGDTVYYNSGVEEYEGTGENQGKWGILGVENGNLLIMSKENIGKVKLKGAQDVLTDGTIKLNNACNAFKNTTYADLVRCVRTTDINRVCGFDEKNVSTIPTFEFIMLDGKVKRNDQQDPSNITSFQDINGKKLPDDAPISVKHTLYTYKLKDKINIDSKAYNLLKDDKNTYWLDSNCVFTNVGDANWGFFAIENNTMTGARIFISYAGGVDRSYGIRPVVTLNVNVKLISNNSDGYIIQ